VAPMWGVERSSQDRDAGRGLLVPDRARRRHRSGRRLSCAAVRGPAKLTENPVARGFAAS
jgi:hypothetical protein